MPKNSSLQRESQRVLKSLKAAESGIIEARGEDVPEWVYNLSSINKKAIGLTGEDLFREFQLKQPECSLKILRKIPWNDPSALYSKPALCLLGPKGKKLSDFPKQIRVGISSKYALLSEKYLASLDGYAFKKILISGCCETLIGTGLADVVIDIVYTGNSMRKAGLDVYDKIFSSDLVIIGADIFWRAK